MIPITRIIIQIIQQNKIILKLHNNNNNTKVLQIIKFIQNLSPRLHHNNNINNPANIHNRANKANWHIISKLQLRTDHRIYLTRICSNQMRIMGMMVVEDYLQRKIKIPRLKAMVNINVNNRVFLLTNVIRSICRHS